MTPKINTFPRDEWTTVKRFGNPSVNHIEYVEKPTTTRKIRTTSSLIYSILNLVRFIPFMIDVIVIFLICLVDVFSNHWRH